MAKLRDPGKIIFWSPIGVFALFDLALGLSLLFVNFVQWIVLKEKKIRNYVYKKIVYFCDTCTSVVSKYKNTMQ